MSLLKNMQLVELQQQKASHFLDMMESLEIACMVSHEVPERASGCRGLLGVVSGFSRRIALGQLRTLKIQLHILYPASRHLIELPSPSSSHEAPGEVLDA